MKATDTSDDHPAVQPKAEHPKQPHLPERELLRRLWRIYEMALVAASRVEAQHDKPRE